MWEIEINVRRWSLCILKILFSHSLGLIHIFGGVLGQLFGEWKDFVAKEGREGDQTATGLIHLSSPCPKERLISKRKKKHGHNADGDDQNILSFAQLHICSIAGFGKMETGQCTTV